MCLESGLVKPSSSQGADSGAAAAAVQRPKLICSIATGG